MQKIKFKRYNHNRTKIERSALCHAPAGTVLFTPTGNAQPCHYNRGFTYGKYPEQSIKTIFESEQRTRLFNELKNYRFPDSCYTCKLAWENKQAYNIGAKKYDNLSNVTTFPELLELQINNQCPLECIMCSGEYSSSIRKNRENKTAIYSPYDLKFVKQLLPYLPNLKRINFTGGEPLLIPLYYNIMEQVIKHKPSIEMNLSTNASVLPRKFLNLLPHGNFSFTVSIDSMNKTMYETIRKNAKFENTLNNIETLQDYCTKYNKKISIKACILTLNYNDIIPLLNHWNNKNIEVYLKPVWFPPHLSLKHAGKQELKHIISAYEQYIPLTNTDIQSNNKKMWLDVIQELKAWYQLPEQIGNNITQTNMLEEMLLNKIQSHLNQNNIEPKDLNNSLSKYHAFLQQTRSYVKNNYQWHQVIRYLHYHLPINILINEFEHGTTESFAGRIAQSSLFEENLLKPKQQENE